MPNLKDSCLQEEAELLSPDFELNTTDQALHAKMDKILVLLTEMKDSLESHKVHTGNELESLKSENKCLKLRLMETEGHATRMFKDIAKLKRDFEDLEIRSMSHNIVIYNLPEQDNEDIYKTVTDVMKEKLKIPEHLIQSKTHPIAPVQIDTAHRMGKANSRNRPTVLKLVLRRGKDIILQHARNLRGTKISVSEQLPSEMRERRMLQLPKLRGLCDKHKGDNSMKVVLSKDKLLVNNSVIPPEFEVNPITLDKTEHWKPLSYHSMQQSEIFEYAGSFFQGHMARITSLEEVRRAYCALLQNSQTAGAHHLMYAYRFSQETDSEDPTIVNGHSDDGEYGGTQILIRLLDNCKLSDVFVAVSRTHNGPNIGKKRFQLIEDSARDVLRI